ncbi:unnamed protein product, partial [Rotaria sp. Silwood1]
DRQETTTEMSVSKFEFIPADIIVEIFQSFLLLNKRFARIITDEYLWNIHIGDNIMSLLMFNNLFQNVLKLIGQRIVSLRIRLSHIVGG